MKRFFFSLHRITGTVIALFFLMWFCTGLVLIYHPYPRISDKQTNAMKENLNDSLPDINAFLPEGGIDSVTSIEVRQSGKQTIVQITTPDSTYKYAGDTLTKPKKVKFSDCKRTACRWAGADSSQIASVDTLKELGQWVMLSKYEKMLPIYKFCFDDEAGHEVFVGKRSGKVLQITTSSQRWWSYVGAIPHKFYFPCLRTNMDLWKWLITVGGIFCLLCAISGMYVGISICVRIYRRKHNFSNPYKKGAYRWHYRLGIIFGIFIIGWGISGSMSMQKVPEWLVPSHNKLSHHDLNIWEGDTIALKDFKLDYRTLSDKYPKLKSVEWLSMNGRPVYVAVVDSNEVFIDASDSIIKPLHLTSDEVKAKVAAMMNKPSKHGHHAKGHHGHGDMAKAEHHKKHEKKNVKVGIELQSDYDNYYMSRNEKLPLPVYRCDVDDEDGSTFYVDPCSTEAKYFNNNRKVRKWLFSAIHYLNIAPIVKHPVIWNICIWILCIGGIIVSGTGVILGVRYLKRKCKK